MAERLRIYEVGPRDGLQNQLAPITTAGKVELVAALCVAGLEALEVTSFVSPRAVPQMADAAELLPMLSGLSDAAPGPDEPAFHALVVNDKGYDRAFAAGARAIAIVAVVTETLSQKNSRMSTADSLAMAARLAGRARGDGVRSRVYLAPAWVCPYDGDVAPEAVIAAAETVWSAQPDELALADTLGHAHPGQVGELFEQVAARTDMSRLAAHLHDTQAMGLANAYAAIAAGVRTLDGSVGGLGGCPFAPGAAGNLATEDLVLMAQKMGFDTGVDLPALWRAVDVAGALVGRALGGRTGAWWGADNRSNTGRDRDREMTYAPRKT